MYIQCNTLITSLALADGEKIKISCKDENEYYEKERFVIFTNRRILSGYLRQNGRLCFDSIPYSSIQMWHTNYSDAGDVGIKLHLNTGTDAHTAYFYTFEEKLADEIYLILSSNT